jgi:hypothetical protein
MSFLFPGFLFGLFALSIPIIIHLFNFRRYKKVYFTNVRFLKELKQESESKSKIKHWLILLSRLLAITCLVFAFAQPFIPSAVTPKSGKKAISVYIDNSFSMESISKTGYLLDIAKTKARELVQAFGATDRFQLLTNDFEGKHQRLLSRDEFLQMLDEVKLSPSFKNIGEVFQRQKDLLNQSGLPNKRVFLLSDFQKSFIGESKIENDTSVSTTLIPLLANTGDNIFIDTCWFESPVQQKGTIQKLHARIVNKSTKNLDNAAIRLFINEKLVTPGSFTSEPGSKTDVVLTYSIKDDGVQNARLEIEDHPVTYDDKLYFSYYVNKSFPVLLVNGEFNKSGQFLRSLLQNDSLFRLTEMNEKAIDFSQFPKNNLVILNEVKQISSGAAQELKKFVAEGGSLGIFPPALAEINSYNSFLGMMGLNTFGTVDTTDQTCEKINFEQGFYSDVFEKKQDNVDLPKVYSHYTVTRATRTTEEQILKLMNGMPMLALYNSGKGKIYLCNTSLDETWSNFVRHALFVPTVYKMAINSELPRPLYFETGGNSVIELKKNDFVKELVYQVIAADKSSQFIPETRVGENKTLLYLQGNVKKNGNYFLKLGDQEISGLSFNYPRKESVLEYWNTDELKKIIAENNLGTWSLLEPSEKATHLVLADIESGTKLWKLFIILTLAFLAIETALIRFMK